MQQTLYYSNKLILFKKKKNIPQFRKLLKIPYGATIVWPHEEREKKNPLTHSPNP